MSFFFTKVGIITCVNMPNVLLFYRYGAPTKLLSDQGREFVNKLNDDLAKKFDIKRMITAAYHPQTNGLAERCYHYQYII